MINFKTYRQGTGEAAVGLADICRRVAQEASVPIFPVVQSVDIVRLSEAGFEVWAQHVDDVEYGANTGYILPEAILAAGAKGVILNHSEKKLPSQVVNNLVPRCRDLRLKTLVCAASVEEAREVVVSKPDFLAYEPPELIGSRNVSVATGKGKVIKEFVEEFTRLPVLVGAGINSKRDVEIALRLGAKGILIASHVVLADNPRERLLDLTGGF